MAKSQAKAAPNKLAVWKFASCDGCQLNLLDCMDEILALTDAVQIAEFREATPVSLEGPYDVSLVEGSITVPGDATRIREIRKNSKFLVTIGACATAGGIQALRNFNNIDDFKRAVYAQPEYIDTLTKSKPISDHVPVDFELRGCPINKEQLLELLQSYLLGRKPQIPNHSVCFECKARGTPCIAISKGIPCLGPVTQAGCNAICPAYNRGCYGCYGPMESPNTDSIGKNWLGHGRTNNEIYRAFQTFNANAPAFRKEAEVYDKPDDKS